MQSRVFAIHTALLAMCLGCGEGDGTSAPIDSPSGELSAATMVASAALLAETPGASDVLYAVSTISREMSNLVAIKLETTLQTPSAPSPFAARACEIETENHIAYQDCEYDGLVVNGFVYSDDTSATVNLRMTTDGNDFVLGLDLDITGRLTFDTDPDTGSLSNLNGSIDFDASFNTHGEMGNSNVRAEFDVLLEETCPVGGNANVRHSARTPEAYENVQVAAGFGPVCGDVAVF